MRNSRSDGDVWKYRSIRHEDILSTAYAVPFLLQVSSDSSFFVNWRDILQLHNPIARSEKLENQEICATFSSQYIPTLTCFAWPIPYPVYGARSNSENFCNVCFLLFTIWMFLIGMRETCFWPLHSRTTPHFLRRTVWMHTCAKSQSEHST